MVFDLQGRAVFVTGADGFIGSHLVERLVERGANVRALVYYNSWNDDGWLSEIPSDALSKISIVRGDVRDAEFIVEAMGDAEFVFHLSSLIAIPYSYSAPRSYIETNVTGALNILQACRRNRSLKRLLHVSTSEVYGTAQRVPIDEGHPLVGQSPYSASKIAADKLAESFSFSFDLPVVIARPFNTFGPRQTARAVIPTIISQLLSGAKELKLGSLTPTRDFNFVTDTADGMIALALSETAEGEVVNIGTGEEWSISQTVDMLKEITNSSCQIVTDEVRIRPEKSEVNRLLACTKKMNALTGWQRQIRFEDGLRQTVNWVANNLHYFNPTIFSK